MNMLKISVKKSLKSLMVKLGISHEEAEKQYEEERYIK